MAKELGCDIVVREFDLQSRYYVHFPTNTLEKVRNSFYHSSYELNSTTKVDMSLNKETKLPLFDTDASEYSETCVHIYVYAYICLCIYMLMHICCKNDHIFEYVCMYVWIYMYVSAYFLFISYIFIDASGWSLVMFPLGS